MPETVPAAGVPGSSPRILVHPGFRKAGSTSIQTLMRRNRDLLAPHVHVFPRAELTKRWRGCAMSYTRSSGRKPLDLDRIRAIAREVAAALPLGDGLPVIISDENLIGNRVHNAAGETIADWAAHILPIFEEAFPDLPLAFFFYTRPRDAWLRSAYNQEVRKHFEARSFEHWLKHVPADFDWTTAETKIAAALHSPVTFIRLEGEIAAGLPGLSLLRAAGVPEDALSKLKDPGRRNESLSPDLLGFLRKVNRLKADNAARRKLRDLAIRERHRFRGEPPKSRTSATKAKAADRTREDKKAGKTGKPNMVPVQNGS